MFSTLIRITRTYWKLLIRFVRKSRLKVPHLEAHSPEENYVLEEFILIFARMGGCWRAQLIMTLFKRT